MEYIYRALNDYDRDLYAWGGNLYNKKAIDNCAYNIFNIWMLSQTALTELTQNEYDEIYHNIKTQCVQAAGNCIHDEVTRKKESVERLIDNLSHQICENYIENTNRILSILSTLQAHLCPGEKNTEWISLSKSIRAIKRYYLKQSRHQVAVVKSNICQIFDFSDHQKLIACDISNRQAIQNNHFLINKPKYYNFPYYQQTKKNCKNFNYSVSSQEVVYYNEIPKEKIITLLSPLETDLALNGILNLPFYEQHVHAHLFYQKLLIQLKNYLINIGGYDDITAYLVEEHIQQQKPIHTLAKTPNEAEHLIHIKKKILSYIPEFHSPLQSGQFKDNIDTMECK